MSIFDILSLLGGLSLFLYGMRIMGGGLREGSSGALRAILQRLTNNILKGFLLGLVITTVIQSSTATIVITSGLVAAGILSLRQSLGIIIGANVGTTVTGQIIRLLDIDSSSVQWLQIFKPSTLAPVALIIGIALIMFFKFRKSDIIGQVVVGFGILFTGLLNMTNAVSALSETGTFNSMLKGIGGSPLLGYGVGLGMSFILQSSSASVGILQAFSTTGLLQFHGIYGIILGIYLGDCLTTAIVCMIGAKADSKRVAIINIMFNIAKTLISLIAVLLGKQIGLLDSIWDQTMNSGAIANTNSLFNIISALLMMPFIGWFEKLSYKIIRGDKEEENPFAEKLAGLDPKFYQTPAIAFYSSYEVLLAMFDTACANFNRAYGLLSAYNQKTMDEIQKYEKLIDQMADRTSQYLVSFSSHIVEENDASTMTQYYKMIAEFERLGDHAQNVAEEAQSMHENDLTISPEGQRELDVLKQLLDRVLETTRKAFVETDMDVASEVEPLEEVVDDMIDYLRDAHLKRLTDGTCSPMIDTAYINLLSDMERLSDICANVAISVIIRKRPELATESHSYVVSLHRGDDEKFNEEYAAAKEQYFKMLN